MGPTANNQQRPAPIALRILLLALLALILALATGLYLALRHPPARYGEAGPLRLRVVLPTDQIGRRQPLLVTGQRDAGAIVYLVYEDEGHLRVGLEVLGYRRETGPLAVDYFAEHEFTLALSGLYPASHAAVASLSRPLRESVRHWIQIDLDGRTVLEEKRPAFDSTPEQVAVGENRIGGSCAEARFTGRIMSVTRLPVQAPVTTAADAVRLTLRFPSNRAGRTEALLSSGPLQQGDLCHVTYLEGNRVRFGCMDAQGQSIASPAYFADPDREHTLAFAKARAAARGPRLVFDDQTVFDFAAWPLPRTEELALISSGFSQHPFSLLFSGPKLAWETTDSGSLPPAGQRAGPLRLSLYFPRHRASAQEPLVTSGRTGAGDFVYVVYLDENHVRFGYDHWGVGGALSEPVALDYRLPHLMEIDYAALHSGAPNSAQPETRLAVSVKCDGAAVLSSVLPAHPSSPEQIAVGANSIGGSTCGPEFTGTFLAAEWLGAK